MSSLERVLALIDERGITAATLTKEAGLDKSTISAWKSGRSKPKAEALQKIADYFGVSIDYLLEKTDDPIPSDRSGDVARLYAALVEAGIVKQGEDLTDKQLLVLVDIVRANREVIRKVAEDYYANKDRIPKD